MKGSQIALLALLGLFAFYIVRLRNTAMDRLAYLALALVGVLLILHPEWTNDLATLLGIGRGADLMFYFFIVFCLFHFATTAARLRRMQSDLATLAREMALRDPRHPDSTQRGG
ncbi:MAG: DUF2304 domain-containing protein [Gemmatimonadota bacterium]